VDDLLGRQDVPPGSDHPPTLFDPCASAQFQEPIAAAVQPGGRALWVVNRGTDNVAVVPMASTGSAAPFGFGGGQASAVAVGSGPTGIAFRRDGSLAYVHNAFDHSVVSIDPNALAPVGEPIAIAGEVLPADVAAGRKLFFSATDPAVTDPTNSISCASCHLEGREDGHVWHFTDGSRQTPQLVGRMVQSTAPYHWNGTLPTLHDFMNRTIQERMGGLGLTAQQESSIEAFLAAAPSPDNPFRGAELNPRQSRGQALFASARCGMCHEGAALTNNAFADVGTLVTGGLLPDDASTLPNGLNVPSLLGVGRSAPYLHDGSAATLEDRLRHNQAADQHGWTSTLSGEDIEDLVAFLKTL
jgi:cytochrome c peroxidase